MEIYKAIVLLFASSLAIASLLDSSDDGIALCEFFATIPHAGQIKLTNWCNPSSLLTTNTSRITYNPCSTTYPWRGVACTSSPSPRISRIDLFSTRLGGGRLPSSFGYLDQLVFFDVSINDLDGTIPSSLGGLNLLTSLDFGGNQFSGSSLIPYLCTLTRLSYLNLSKNKLSGKIPQCIGNLAGLTYLSLWQNSFVGRLPSSITALTNMKNLFVDNNKFTGPVPDVGALRGLVMLNMFNNKFTSTIPASLGSCRNLTRLGLHSNMFRGPIPLTLSSLRKLTILELYFNSLTGTIPSFVLPAIKTIKLNNNQLEGTIPTSLSSLTKVLVVNFSQNALVGTLPQEVFAAWSVVEYISLSDNRFTGQLPTSVTTSSKLAVFDAHSNFITGTIPTQLSRLSNLVLLQLAHNILTGHIPVLPRSRLRYLFLDHNEMSGPVDSSFCSLSRLQEAVLSNNRFTSSLPTCLGQLRMLQTLDLSRNVLTGGFPPIAVQGSKLELVRLSHNNLSGTVEDLSSLRQLNTLTIDHNSFHGSISVFDPAAQAALSNIDLSSNSFSGPLPDNLFLLPALTHLAVASNCFSGILPNSICSCTKLQTLILDGLTSGQMCEVEIWQTPNAFSLSGTYTRQSVDSTIPSCIFTSIPNITTLHLSGNGFRGPAIPQFLKTWPKQLQDLSMAHNRLNGTISMLLQQDMNRFAIFDLSHNRIGGDVSHATVPLQEFKMDVNRLSGFLSKPIVDIGAEINRTSSLVFSILDSNTFDCYGSSLPALDPYLSRYQCGSSALNKVLYVFIAMVGAVALGAIVVRLMQRRMSVDLKVGNQGRGAAGIVFLFIAWATDPKPLPEPAQQASLIPCPLSLLMSHLTQTRNFLFRILAINVFVLLPLYAILSHTNGTHAFEYGWTVSAAMKSGIGASITLLVVWTGLLLVYEALLSVHFKKAKQGRVVSYAGPIPYSSNLDVSLYTGTTAKQYCLLFARLSLIIIIDLIFILSANIFYVLINTSGTVAQQATVKLAFSLYKHIWNTAVLSWLVTNPHLKLGLPAYVFEISAWLKGGVMFQLAIVVVNNIIIPAIASATTDERCFKSIFYSNPPIVSTFFAEQQIVQNFAFPEYRVESGLYLPNTTAGAGIYAISTVQQSSSFSPPFMYNYQCSTSLLQSYVPVFVLMAIFSAFATPLKYLVAKWATDHLAAAFSSNPSSRRFITFAHRILLKLVPKPLWSAEDRAVYYGVNGATTRQDSAPSDLDTSNHNLDSLRNPISSSSVSLDMDRYYLETLSDIVIALTYGIAAPLLLFPVVFSILCRVWRLQFMIHCYVQPNESSQERNDAAKAMAESNPILTSRFFYVLFPPFFLGLFLTDIAADEAGIKIGLWAPLCMLLLPLACLAVLRKLKRVLSDWIRETGRSSAASMHNDGDGDGLEMCSPVDDIPAETPGPRVSSMKFLFDIFSIARADSISASEATQVHTKETSSAASTTRDSTIVPIDNPLLSRKAHESVRGLHRLKP